MAPPCPVAPGPPPPARGRRHRRSPPASASRTTPASAGTTAGLVDALAGERDHPRQRGDDAAATSSITPARGPPPPARGRRQLLTGPLCRLRTTPASAGTTRSPTAGSRTRRDHPRQRGDDGPSPRRRRRRTGPPPPARGRRRRDRPPARGLRTTPASAGTTTASAAPCRAPPDHPRQRGDDVHLLHVRQHPGGPPPPARGRLACAGKDRVMRRTTPASAGTTDRAGGPACRLTRIRR